MLETFQYFAKGVFHLDLSFNNIEVIEGLEKLTRLRDLTLYNNRITLLENMDSLVDLHVFSAGNNKLEQLENVSTVSFYKALNNRENICKFEYRVCVH